MDDRPTQADAGTYAIRLGGHLHRRWATWFEGMTIEDEEGGVTVLLGSIPDQAALHGLLARIRDLGLPLLSVTRDGEEPQPDPKSTDSLTDHERTIT